MTRLIVAAGGGGDAVAASMLDAALYGSDEPTIIYTYAWERLIIDPRPGPRSPTDFTGLRPLTPSVHTITAATKPIAPSGSSLPRLARGLPQTFALADPARGAQGLAEQLESLLDHLNPSSIDLLDVGGDILAEGHEPALRSPLADALMLAACCQIRSPIRLLIAGPGLDGEIPATQLRDLFGPSVLTLNAAHVEPIAAVLDWHPSEATALLAATARGIRGTCEIRDAGLAVPLTNEGPTVHETDIADALNRNRLARAIPATTTLDEAEQLSREICGYSEIDHERNKAAWLSDQPEQTLDADITLTQIAAFETAALERGITHTTFRRLTEALEVGRAQRLALRQLLITSRPEQYAAPLWQITHGAESR